MAQQPSIPDYYAILGTKPSATGIEIQRCYRKLVRVWRRPGLQAGVGVLAMVSIDEAYATLKNQEKRKAYDAEWPSIKKAWKKFQQRKIIAAQADDDEEMSDVDSDLDEDEDEVATDGEEKADDEDDTDDGGPDGEAEDADYTDREESDDDEVVVAKRGRMSRVVYDSEDDEVVVAKPICKSVVATKPIRKSIVVYNSEDEIDSDSDSEPEAEFTDDEEPESSDEDVDENVDRYAKYCTGYESESGSDSDDETRYAVQLRSGKWMDLHKHNEQDPHHEMCMSDHENNANGDAANGNDENGDNANGIAADGDG
ncbi:hypothetical protein M409DRAFT_48481 [Zasmidium cellare ATCC 36951]|uniref:J domain-containing protein n=1 Tax=Zasmidium cellare ATCC 36951 TaxID=1080233 RepID=A0A6A6D7A8_ZASCE|nr:uncharacterized protein M409DRAFT_48481 [Zasmidium cellare ATCC 36951]KAF2173516.1 hypothetical protein M409DRAFT_48481 [Zasmidium cellare ATCC 36951]